MQRTVIINTTSHNIRDQNMNQKNIEIANLHMSR